MVLMNGMHLMWFPDVSSNQYSLPLNLLQQLTSPSFSSFFSPNQNVPFEQALNDEIRSYNELTLHENFAFIDYLFSFEKNGSFDDAALEKLIPDPSSDGFLQMFMSFVNHKTLYPGARFSFFGNSETFIFIKFHSDQIFYCTSDKKHFFSSDINATEDVIKLQEFDFKKLSSFYEPYKKYLFFTPDTYYLPTPWLVYLRNRMKDALFHNISKLFLRVSKEHIQLKNDIFSSSNPEKEDNFEEFYTKKKVIDQFLLKKHFKFRDSEGKEYNLGVRHEISYEPRPGHENNAVKYGATTISELEKHGMNDEILFDNISERIMSNRKLMSLFNLDIEHKIKNRVLDAEMQEKNISPPERVFNIQRQTSQFIRTGRKIEVCSLMDIDNDLFEAFTENGKLVCPFCDTAPFAEDNDFDEHIIGHLSIFSTFFTEGEKNLLETRSQIELMRLRLINFNYLAALYFEALQEDICEGRIVLADYSAEEQEKILNVPFYIN